VLSLQTIRTFTLLLTHFANGDGIAGAEQDKITGAGRRFNFKLGKLPYGYDHKYIYSHIGYNLKLTDIQAAIGLAQLEKLPEFIKKRWENLDFTIRQFFELFLNIY